MAQIDDQPDFPDMYAEFVAEMDATNSGTVMDAAYIARKQRLADFHADFHKDRPQRFVQSRKAA